MNRTTMLRRLGAETANWDVLVIGGGATGLGTAVDASARGLRTALVEQGDFAQATSSRSSKLIHGGIRYLKQGRLGLVRESLRERRLLLHNAPHLVRPLAFVVPNYDWWERAYYGAGLRLYDWLGGEFGGKSGGHLGRARTLDYLPTLKPDGLRGGMLYHDGLFDDARLAVTLAQTVADLQGVVVNYAKVISLVKQNGPVSGVLVRDLETGSELEVHARVVINATGVFADEVRRLDNPARTSLLTTSQGTHLVLDRSFLPGDCALMAPRTTDGRIFFAIPWHDRVIIGTTDTAVAEAALEPRPLQSEVQFLLEHAGQYLTRPPGVADILSAFAGLRPLLKGRHGKSTAALPRRHLVEVSQSGLVTITGGKWTTYRQMAEDAVTQATKVAGLPRRSSRTRHLPLHGGENRANHDPTFAQYGDDAPAVRALCDQIEGGHTQLHPRLPCRSGEVRWAVRHEMARTLADMLARRTRALLLDARACLEIAPGIAKIMAEELGRDVAWEEQQVEGFRELARGYLFA